MEDKLTNNLIRESLSTKTYMVIEMLKFKLQYLQLVVHFLGNKILKKKIISYVNK